MRDTDLFKTLLGLQDPWEVTSLTTDIANKEVRVRIEWPKGRPAPCPECGASCPLHDHREIRSWRHLDTMQFATLIECQTPRTRCQDHGVKSISVPWAKDSSRFTLLFERFAIDVLLACQTKSQAMSLLRMSWDEVHRIQERAVERGVARRNEFGLEQVGMDEKAFGSGHNYTSQLYDLKKATVIDLVPGRDEGAARTLWSSLPASTRHTIEVVAMDMWKPFLKATRDLIPNADIVHDKFHIMAHLGKAVDEVRKKEHGALMRKGEDILKGSKYLWLKNPNNWDADERHNFRAYQQAGLKVSRAWAIKETFAKFWEYRYEKPAQDFFNDWHWWATHSRMKPMVKVAKMLKKHCENVFTFTKHRITNAVAEGLNSKIQVLRSCARGYRNFSNYRHAVLFHCGGLELYP